ncbi:alpha/beta fold hydrolase [Actinomycetospora lemnae]|uniref:Alpha/beta fold hydrolase n=1 Tax=Actinomycetospora lemnae TaxID=3019891 RepID=A0ABT5T144_9PSEU|nr:alpha/beta fold hydrolase [Actinomycetospora sp. DW7H6]MDD7968420.1 alpha/beta fold hydrolase [Actinomycetospora sp. DW7H6]
MTGTLATAGPDGTAADLRPRRWHRAVIVVALVALAGSLTALAMPRGPITPVGVVVAMAVGAAVGTLAGFVLRSRWAMLLAPVVFAVAVELGRVGVVGPTVDRPQISTFFGVLVLVLGRGFHALVQLLPMVLGAAVGAGLARRRSGAAVAHARRRAAQWARRGVAALVAVALVAVAVVLTRPGTTAPIVDPAGRPVPGSVAELATVRLGGHDQTVMIRGRDANAPVVLYLAGGPGQSDLGYARAYMTELEDDVVVAVWDQRGTGTSYAALDPTSTWTLDRAVEDTAELATYLRDRFGQQKVYLVGNSWGSTLGVLAVQRHPELFAAYVGTGQMASQLEADRIIYGQVLDLAARTGDVALTERMRAAGPPPYRDVYVNAMLIDYYDAIGPYPRTEYFRTQGPPGIDGTGADEYGPLDKVNKLKAMIDMGSVMYPQLQGIDFRTQVPRLEVPVYVVAGAHELTARSGPARQWFDRLDAPVKQWITFERSGHVPQFEEFERFRQVLRDVVARHGVENP